MPDRDPPPSLLTALMIGQGLFPGEPAFTPAVPANTGRGDPRDS
jgi:hypothetical protein